MGLVTDSMRLTQLQGQRSDLNFKISEIVTTKSNLINAGDDLTRVGTDYDPDSPVMKMLEQRRAKVKLMEEKLDKQMQKYQIQLQMVEAEYQACKGRLNSEISQEMSYSL